MNNKVLDTLTYELTGLDGQHIIFGGNLSVYNVIRQKIYKIPCDQDR